MVTRMAATLLATAVGATAFAATPAYADPAPAPKIVSISTNPNPVVVKKDGSTQVTVSVRTSDVADVKVSIEPAYRGGWGQGQGGAFTSVDKDAVAKFTAPVAKTFDKPFTLDWRAPVGSWKIHVWALGYDGRVYDGDGSFEVKRGQIDVPRPTTPKATRIVDLEASKNPVRKGRKFTLSGELKVAQCWGDWYYDDWDDYYAERGGSGHCDDGRRSWNDWQDLGDQKVGVYFQPRGSSEWKYVGYTTTDDDGSFEARVRAYESGTWCVKFDGNNRLGGSQASEYVRVRKNYYNY